MNIEAFRQLCLSLPHSTEDVKWEKDLCFCIGDKMFAVTGLTDEHAKASFKTSPESFTKLIELEGIEPAPYLARYKWVQAKFDALTDAEWNEYVQLSYKLVKDKLPAKKRKGLS